MKKIVMIAISACIIGCGGDANAKTTTTEKLETVANVIVVPNTESINYALYRQAWRTANNKPAPPWAPDFTATTKTHKDPEDPHEIVEIELSDLKFKDAFRIEFLGKGEGHVFWWRGKEYSTNLLDVVRKPLTDKTEPFIERINRGIVVPVDVEDVREGGGDQGTIE
tara:strand:+ start:28 stop:528 length:501 start_codon:yes stop_codon:yes gene_type:complete